MPPVTRLDARDPRVAARIHEIWMASYREEARLLGVEDFPPLRRTAEDLSNSSSTWFGLSVDGSRVGVAAVAAVEDEGPHLHLGSLVVHPDFFRQGLASRLLRHLLDEEYPGRAFTVATGAANIPALRLYEKLGFRIHKRWETEEGIPKVQLERPATAVQATDGFSLAATWTLPGENRSTETPRAVVVVNSAAAVPRGYYRPFAEFLAAADFAVLTYDYRGIGESLPTKSLRGFPATMGDWARKDFAGVLAAVKARYPGLPCLVVGHSFGGQAVGFTPEATDVAGAVMVASQSGYWGHWPGLLKFWIVPMWFVVIPGLCHLWGYLPEWVGVGKGMPKGVALEWAKWGRHRDYAFGYLPRAKEQAAAFSAPILSFSIDDDTYAPRPSVEALLTYFQNAETEHRHLVPRVAGFDGIGHFGFFRASRKALWEPIRDWLLRQVSGQAGGSPTSHRLPGGTVYD